MHSHSLLPFRRLMVCAAFLAITLTPIIMPAASRDESWMKIDEALKQGLPKTAIELLLPVESEAVRDRAFAEAARALVQRIALEGVIQGNKPEEKITRLEAAFDAAAPEVRPALDAILAHWYWQYFQQNRWRFMRRTATAEAPGQDFTTWDLPRLFAAIDARYRQALSADMFLRSTPVAAWDRLLDQGTMPDRYRPTLFDFIAQEALQFYTSGEQAAAKPADAFQPDADSPMLAPASEFIAWNPQTADTNSPVLRAILLYQQILRFHQDNPDPSAFLDADIARLVYARNAAFGESKNPRFKKTLQAIADQWGDHELASTACYQWARVLREENDLVQARAIALRGKNAHPDSPGGRLCHNLILEIDTPALTIATERIWNEPLPKIRVQYRNIDRVHFRAIPSSWDSFLDRRRNRPSSLTRAERIEILQQKPAREWSQPLPPTSDYQTHTADLPAPAGLKPGFYFLVGSRSPDFGESTNQVSMADVWVSDLALVLRPRAGQLEGFLLEARSGEPIAGATIDAWQLDRSGNRVAVPARTTDDIGAFAFPKSAERGLLVRARHRGHAIASEFDAYIPSHEPPTPDRHTIFFTDRAIYRPGQTIQYKGICLSVDPAQNQYRLLPGQSVTVTFSDPNGKEIARQTHRANDFGSFAGSFTAPRDRVLGAMLIHTTQGPDGSTHFRVEEYKRPRFQVTLDAPASAPRLRESVTVKGRALAYTGAAIDGAQVAYRVVRQVRMPPWWGWFRRGFIDGPASSPSQEIAHGTTQTAPDGSFAIEFRALPDPAVPEKDEPTFVFRVHADVTDAAGETRSDERAVPLGYTALSARIEAEEWQVQNAPVALTIRTESIDGTPQTAEGSLKIYALHPPPQVQRPDIFQQFRYGPLQEDQPGPSGADPNQWPLGSIVSEKGITTDADGRATWNVSLPAGLYRALLQTQDRFGKNVTAQFPIRVLDPDSTRLALRIPHLLALPQSSAEPGDPFYALWGTGYDQGRALIEIEHRGKILSRRWTPAGQTQARIPVDITENLRGGLHLHVTQIRENRAYLDTRFIEVPWTPKHLDIRWEHFTSKLQPGKSETWTAVLTGPQAEKAAAEMVATLYDASLDAFVSHDWIRRFGFFYRDYETGQPQFMNRAISLQRFLGSWEFNPVAVDIRYRAFPPEILGDRYYLLSRRGVMPSRMLRNAAPTSSAAADREMIVLSDAAPMAAMAAPAPMAGKAAFGLAEEPVAATAAPAPGGGFGGAAPAESKKADLSQVAARKNLNETAFFFPQLLSDRDGIVRMTFTMPEALTEWRLLGFAHDRQLRSGFIEARTVTAKDLMVQPNAPRFLREGDVLEFAVKVSNQSNQRQSGRVRLTFLDGMADQPADALLGLSQTEQPFDIPSKESRAFHWRITIPDGLSVLTFKAVAASDKVSDGEEGCLPVLARRILVTESLPLPIRGPATRQFRFERLLESARSNTLRHQSLTVQMVSQPAWYAVLALPYLLEFPHECAEQIFNRLYANALARFIAQSDPKIRRIFDQWKNTPALDSPLEKNEDLKNVLLAETPWVRQAQSESQTRRNLGVLFDDNRLNYELDKAQTKLADMQNGDGSWPWFPGGPANDYITLYITTGFGRLRHLGVDLPVDPALKSLARLDSWIDRIYRDILEKGHPDDNHLSSTIALYLYGRSFFLKDRPLQGPPREAVNYFLGQARKFWLSLGHRQSQGHLALALQRFGDPDAAQAILRSLKERSVTSDELGRFWRDTEISWWWYRAPIETQALMIEAFAEIARDESAVEECQTWLLKQKQTQNWKTTKATADAIYALLLRGSNLLASDRLVQVSLGGLEITPRPGPSTPGQPPAVEPGTGYYEKRFSAPEIQPRLGEITVRKLDDGVAWGSIHWQYLEDAAKVAPYQGTPLQLAKTLFVRRNTARGPMLEPIRGPLAVGDELVVRLELRVDRDMEYVHLKDQRGSGIEPLAVLSGYRYQDGLAYYESTRDAASHFFIDYLPKGAYVFEYAARVFHRGRYQSGLAEIQCMYAPEFNSHSQSILIEVGQ